MLKLSARQIEDFQKKLGRKASPVLKYLSRNVGFYEAFTSPLGEEIIKEHAVNMDKLLEKIYNEEATDKEKAEFRVLKEIGLRIVKKINAYNNHISSVEKGA
ncbi:MAG: hypothetical protein ACE5DX_05615 [Candidatus Dojkabacteria bacterium]